jgi:predicted alpha/beta-hydrolase family hydrolase
VTSPTALRFTASSSSGEVSALLVRPAGARALMALAHGAGAGMRHPGMESNAALLADKGIASLRYQFPYMERGGGRIDPQPILLATVRAAVRTAREAAPDLPLLAGGRSMGGRMTSLAAAAEPLEGVRGLVFFAFPLHAAGRPGTERAEHLARVTVPMLFLQGTRDPLSDLTLLGPVLERLGERVTLHVVDGADHSFAVLKRSGRSKQDVLEELGDAVVEWAAHRGVLPRENVEGAR